MNNSASDIKAAKTNAQTLRTRAAHLLPKVTAALTDFGYHEISHQRISQQALNPQQNNKIMVYQGLTKAVQQQFGCVMIKWSLVAIYDQTSFHDQSSSEVNATLENPLHHELENLTTLAQLQKPAINIAPPIWTHDSCVLQTTANTYTLSFFVMPYYKNGSLAHYLRQYTILSDLQKYHLILQSARLIAQLHQIGWLHNDIKPSNILLKIFASNNSDNSKLLPRLLLTDFALAQRCEEITYEKPAGTPAYLAPECWQGKGASVQSDIYAFGIMMVEILTDSRPFKMQAQTNNQVWENWAIAHCQKSIPKLPEAYQAYQEIINNALAKRIEKRYKNMEEVISDLEKTISK